MGRHDPLNALHEGISEAIQATALFPLMEEGRGYDLLDIVRFNPGVSDRKMIRPLHVGLRSVLLEDEKKVFKKLIPRDEKALEDKRLFSTSMFATKGKIALKALGEPYVSASRSSSKLLVTDFRITGAKRRALKEGSDERIRKMIKKRFAKLMLIGAFNEAVRERFMIGVIIANINGKLQVFCTRERSKSKKLEAGVYESGPGMACTIGNGTEVSSMDKGIIGIELLCFLAECNSKNRMCTLSRGFRLIPGKDDFFPQCLSFIAAQRRIFKSSRALEMREHLFSGSTIIDENNTRLDPKERKEFRKIIEKLGKLPSLLDNAEQLVREHFFKSLISRCRSWSGMNFLNSLWQGYIVNRPHNRITSS